MEKKLIELSSSSRDLLDRLNRKLDKRKIFSLDEYFCGTLKSKGWRIMDRDDLTIIVESCNIYPTPDQINDLYNELMNHKTRLVQFQHLSQILKNIKKMDRSTIQKNCGQNQIIEMIRKDNNLNSIIETIGAIAINEFLSKELITEIINNFSFKNPENVQFFIDSILNGSQFIPVEDFIKKIQAKISNMRLPIQKELLIQQNKGDVQRIQMYFNSPIKIDQTVINTAKKYLIADKIFNDDKNPTCKEAKEWVHLVYDKIGYQFFQKIQQSKLKHFLRAKHVIQGKIQDCYLLSAMAVLAETFPQMVYRLFVLLQNPSHLYAVRLFIEGQWQTVSLDLQFPVHKNRNFAGARSQHQKIWPMLLEKAYAKINNSYDNIEGGTNQQGIELISGAPSYTYDTSKPISWNRNIIIEVQNRQIYLQQNMLEWSEVFSDIIQVQSFNKSILTCTCKDSTEEERQNLKQIGLSSKHSYSILKVFPNKKGLDGKSVTLIKLSNPWGKNLIMYGPWSLYGKLWTDDLRRQLGYKVNSYDGSFFMCEEDFFRYFARFNICRVNPDYKNSSFDLAINKSDFTAVKIYIQKKGRYTFTTYLKDRRKITKKYKKFKLQRYSWMFLLKKQAEGYKRVCCNYFQLGNNMTEHSDELQGGDYILMSKILWTHPDDEYYRLAIYGPGQVTIVPIQFEDSYLQEYIEMDSQKVQKLSFKENEDKYTFKKVKFYPLFGYGFIEIQNKQKQVFDVKIQFGKHTYFYIIGKRPIHLQIRSGQKISRKFIVKQYFNEAEINFKYSYLNLSQNK